MSDWYDPDGNVLTDTSQWSSREPGGMWDRERLYTAVEGGGVSTVWLSLDHSHSGGPPLIFESLVSAAGPLDQMMDRYPTREAAHEGHAALVERVRTERQAWHGLLGDERVADCARLVADALMAHCKAHGAEYFDLGDVFGDLIRDLTKAAS